jgi:hypothetical protein
MSLQKFKHDLINQPFQNAVENAIKSANHNLSFLTFSQSCQDLFVVAMLEGKSKGTFLEIGCGQPKYGNNTFVLENFFLFTGVSIDLNYDDNWSANRHLNIVERSWPLCRPATLWHKTDALNFDYSSLPNYFDYLQIDIDPPKSNLELLEKLCSTKKFAVITFEHDDWDSRSFELNIKRRSREFLLSKGYILIGGDIGGRNNSKLVSYEDWWVHPNFIKKEIIDAYKTITPVTKHWSEVLFKR